MIDVRHLALTVTVKCYHLPSQGKGEAAINFLRPEIYETKHQTLTKSFLAQNNNYSNNQTLACLLLKLTAIIIVETFLYIYPICKHRNFV